MNFHLGIFRPIRSLKSRILYTFKLLCSKSIPPCFKFVFNKKFLEVCYKKTAEKSMACFCFPLGPRLLVADQNLCASYFLSEPSQGLPAGQRHFPSVKDVQLTTDEIKNSLSKVLI